MSLKKSELVRENTHENRHVEMHAEQKNTQKTLNDFLVKDLMQSNPLTLTEQQTIYQALSFIVDNKISSAPVLDENKQLVGFISEQDILRVLWSKQYSNTLNDRVTDVMQTEMLTVDAMQPVSSLLEFMVVDKEKLFALNEPKALGDTHYQNYEQRLKSATVQRPSSYAVLHEGLFCGVITRQDVAKQLCLQYKNNATNNVV